MNNYARDVPGHVDLEDNQWHMLTLLGTAYGAPGTPGLCLAQPSALRPWFVIFPPVLSGTSGSARASWVAERP